MNPSVLAGTVLHRSHLPIKTWFRAMRYICASKSGASALNLQQCLGIASYNTAWLCLHKLRRAMVRPGRALLSGSVEADETCIGAPQEGKRGRGAFGKRIVFAAVEARKTEKSARRKKKMARSRQWGASAFWRFPVHPQGPCAQPSFHAYPRDQPFRPMAGVGTIGCGNPAAPG